MLPSTVCGRKKEGPVDTLISWSVSGNHGGSLGHEPATAFHAQCETRRGGSVDNQTGKSKGFTRTLLIPMANPLMKGAGKVGEAAQAGLLLGARMFGTDGGGVKISNHWGIAAESAAKAYIGGGTLKNGGRGMAGGEARLAIVGTAVAGVLIVGVVGTSLYADYVLAKQSDQSPVADTCEKCCGPLRDASGDGSAAQTAATCPQCEPGNSSLA